jgi:hypothetical protein
MKFILILYIGNKIRKQTNKKKMSFIVKISSLIRSHDCTENFILKILQMSTVRVNLHIKQPISSFFDVVIKSVGLLCVSERTYSSFCLALERVAWESILQRQIRSVILFSLYTILYVFICLLYRLPVFILHNYM